jgi:hypothetical protein
MRLLAGALVSFLAVPMALATELPSTNQPISLPPLTPPGASAATSSGSVMTLPNPAIDPNAPGFVPLINSEQPQTPEAAAPAEPAASGKEKSRSAHEKPAPTPVGAIAVFPVVMRNNVRVFGDLSVLFADEFATILGNRAKGTKVLNPVYAVEELKVRGLGGVYQKVIDYYIKAHRPEPKALNFLVKELGDTEGRKIERVVFVETELDVNYFTKSTRLIDRLKQIATDDLPKDSTYYVRSRIQVFDTTQPEAPMIWAFTWHKVVHGDNFYNATPSVFQDSDSLQTFAHTSRWMSREILVTLPRHVYQHTGRTTADAQVQGEVLH